jgi:hypothetical protein
VNFSTTDGVNEIVPISKGGTGLTTIGTTGQGIKVFSSNIIGYSNIPVSTIPSLTLTNNVIGTGTNIIVTDYNEILGQTKGGTGLNASGNNYNVLKYKFVNSGYKWISQPLSINEVSTIFNYFNMGKTYSNYYDLGCGNSINDGFANGVYICLQSPVTCNSSTVGYLFYGVYEFSSGNMHGLFICSEIYGGGLDYFWVKVGHYIGTDPLTNFGNLGQKK